MQAIYRHGGDGTAIDYTPTENAVAAGEVVVINNLIGIAHTAIAVGVKGALHVNGVYDILKVGDYGQDMPAGDPVYWDDTGKGATDNGGHDSEMLGFAISDSPGGTQYVRVWLGSR